MTITFKDATTQPEKMRPLTYGDLRPGDLFSYADSIKPTYMKADGCVVHLGTGRVYHGQKQDALVRRFHVTATIDRAESEVEE